MKRQISILNLNALLAGLTLAVITLACGSHGAETILLPGSLAAITSEAQALVTDPVVKTWPYAPGWQGKQAFGGSHASVKEIFVNAAMSAAASSTTALATWPNESIVIKFGYDQIDAVDPLVSFIMWKRQGAWYYWEAHSDPELSGGGVEAPSCKRCHINDSRHDAVVAFPLPGT